MGNLLSKFSSVVTSIGLGRAGLGAVLLFAAVKIWKKRAPSSPYFAQSATCHICILHRMQCTPWPCVCNLQITNFVCADSDLANSDDTKPKKNQKTISSYFIPCAKRVRNLCMLMLKFFILILRMIPKRSQRSGFYTSATPKSSFSLRFNLPC